MSGTASPPDDPGSASRARAAQALLAVLDRGRGLESVLAGDDGDDRPFVRELAATALRHAPALGRLWTELRGRSAEADDPRLRALGLLGLAQIFHTRVPDHAAVSATVGAARRLGLGRGGSVLNAVLRRALRERTELEQRLADDPEFRYVHPSWWIERVRRDWPCDWETVLRRGLERAPLTLRVNTRRTDVASCRELFAREGLDARPTRWAPTGLVIATPRPTAALPGYASGWIAVQDEAAQLAATLLDCGSATHVLDACAAPGNKLAHLRETAPPGCRLLGLDIDPRRLARAREELERLGHRDVELRAADATAAEAFTPDERFDRILLDAPCTASGTVRRHPEIKSLRRPEDVTSRAALARRLLDNLWPRLRPGGRLLFASCSLFREETDEVVAAFLAAHPEEAGLVDLPVGWGRRTAAGFHVLTGDDGMDGFFYALLAKRGGGDEEPPPARALAAPPLAGRYSTQRR